MIEQLYDAAPFIGRFRETVFVIKIGGEILLGPRRLGHLTRQVQVLWQMGVHPVVVHGGGPQLDRALQDAGHETEKVEGRRITDARTLEVAKGVFRGGANLDLVTAFMRQGVPAVGVSGADAGLLLLKRRPPVDIGGRRVDFGYVGDPVKVDPRLLKILLEADFVPVVCSLGADAEGQVLNVNGDTVACELAVSLNATKLMFVTDRQGILHDPDDASSIYSTLDRQQATRLVEQGVVKGGMAPKVAAALSALERGVPRVHIVGADEPDSLLEEVFTNQGCGTMLMLEREGSP